MAKRAPNWADWPDERLLALRFCDLGLRLEDSPLPARIAQLYAELAERGLRLRPHCWLAEEWFSPDGVPGIAIPFYLAHPRLMRLEARQMFEVEGGGARDCLRLLRHEAGHAYDTAYGLRHRPRWRRVFGDPRRPYPRSYRPRPESRRHVQHLDWWYAQAHPTEDFAETFAVWLAPRSDWRRRYAGWPALAKLEYVDRLMAGLAGRPPLRRSRRHVEPIAASRETLAEHYARKRRHYGADVPEPCDEALERLFAPAPRARRRAATLLKRIGPALCRICARHIGQQPYAVAQVLNALLARCRALDLRVGRPEAQVRDDLLVFLTVQTLHAFQDRHYRIPL
ncbi:MAG: hypothetical protein KatS3mg121_0730 [Gammaproteobacteria bacterium]|nr:MAG: hypothetical protein KatS3mg121_0730 [Gammaproteobacteria bacterium]